MKKIKLKTYGWFEPTKKGMNIYLDNDTYFSLTNVQLKSIRRQLVWKFDRRFKEVV